MYFVSCPEKLEKFNESDIFQVSEIFPRVLSLFTDAFDIDAFQRAILYQKEGYLVIYLEI